MTMPPNPYDLQAARGVRDPMANRDDLDDDDPIEADDFDDEEEDEDDLDDDDE